MCHEFWRNARTNAGEQVAAQKAGQLIEQARSAKPVAVPETPAEVEQQLEQETIPA